MLQQLVKESCLTVHSSASIRGVLVSLFVASFMLLLLFQRQQYMKRVIDSAKAEYTPDFIFPSVVPRSRLMVLDENGRFEMNHSTVVIAGLIRNQAGHMQFIVEQLLQMAAQFLKVDILIVENDSVDNTRDLLLSWAETDKRIHILGCGVNSLECSLNFSVTQGHSIWDRDRIKKMAFLRNIYMDYIRQNFANYQYLLVWDVDLFGYLYIDGVWNTFGHFYEAGKHPLGRPIDGVCVSSYYINWDYGGWTYHDPFAHIEEGQVFLPGVHENHIRSKMRDVLKRGADLWPVQSCFGGFAVYRMESVVNRLYNYTVDLNSTNLCEHVYFNKGLRIFTNPSMIFTIFYNPD